MSAILSLGEAIAKLLEPWPDVPGPVTTDGVRSVAATSGVTVDLNMARPFNWEPNHLYGWPTQHAHPLAEVGNPPVEREDFSFQFVYVADREDEESKHQRRRDVSDVLDAKGHAYARAIAYARTLPTRATAPWEDIRSSIDHNTTVTFQVRGIGALVAGYRQVSYA